MGVREKEDYVFPLVSPIAALAGGGQNPLGGSASTINADAALRSSSKRVWRQRSERGREEKERERERERDWRTQMREILCLSEIISKKIFMISLAVTSETFCHFWQKESKL